MSAMVPFLRKENDYYKRVLDKKGRPVPERDIIRWGRWRDQNRGRMVLAKTTVGKAEVSTVFLGLDHGFYSPVPVLWETMIFGGERDGTQWRYATRNQAAAHHDRIVKELKSLR